jgi:hypothetical protein
MIGIQIAVNFFNIEDKLSLLNKGLTKNRISKLNVSADPLKNVVINDAFLVDN